MRPDSKYFKVSDSLYLTKKQTDLMIKSALVHFKSHSEKIEHSLHKHNGESIAPKTKDLLTSPDLWNEANWMWFLNKTKIRLTTKSKVEHLIQVIGNQAFKALLNGEKLNVWKNSSPSNYYIESSNPSHQYLYHSKSEQFVSTIPLSLFKIDSSHRGKEIYSLSEKVITEYLK
jgi:hypothetical protein